MNTIKMKKSIIILLAFMSCFIFTKTVSAGEVVFGANYVPIDTAGNNYPGFAAQELKNDQKGNVYLLMRKLNLSASHVSYEYYADIFFNVSHDNGLTWRTGDIKLNNTPPVHLNKYANLFRLSCDNNGNVYASWCYKASDDSKYQVYFTRSNDYGNSWSTPILIIQRNDDGCSFEMVNDNNGSVYFVWNDYVNGNYKVYLNRSLDAGRTWLSSPITVKSTTGNIKGDTARIACNDSGYVYVLWLDAFHYGNLEGYFYVKSSSNKGTSWGSEKKLSFSSSYYSFRNGDIYCDQNNGVYVLMRDWYPSVHFSYSKNNGVSWATKGNILNIGQCGRTEFSCANNGKLYLGYISKGYETAPANIQFIHSENYGANWSTPALIAAGKTVGQYTSNIFRMKSDLIGRVYILWQDDSGRMYLRRSTDGGFSWGANIRVNNNELSPLLLALGIDESGTIFVVWLSSSSMPSNCRYYANSAYTVTDQPHTATIGISSYNSDRIFPGKPLAARIYLTNTGTSAWTTDIFHCRAHAIDPYGNFNWDAFMPAGILPHDIVPGETIEMDLTIPTGAGTSLHELGTYRIIFDMVQEGVAWFHGGGGAELVLNVIEAPVFNQNFIRAEGEVFKDGNNIFYFAGTNCYYLMEFGSETLGGYKNKAGVDEVLTEAKQMGLDVVRTWAFSDYLQPQQGIYDEAWLRGLDYVLYKADQLGLRVVLVLINNWSNGHYRGIDKYIEWNGGTITHDQFFSSSTYNYTRGYYKQHAAKLINRINYYNGRLYRDDPTIFSWELCNEPRTEIQHTFSADLDDWIACMSTYVKSLDPNHMVSTGLEGFYSNRTDYYDNGMGNGYTGADFVINHNHPNIDFATTHLLPDDWSQPASMINTWISLHLNDAKNLLHKPLVLEEIGIKRASGETSTERDNAFREAFNIMYSLNGAGSMFWTSYGNDYPDYDEYGVYYPNDASTVNIISTHAANMNAKIAPFWNMLLPIGRTACWTASKSGAASAKMILEYLNGQQYDLTTLYNFGRSHQEPQNSGISSLDPTAVAAILNQYKLPEYNFTVITENTAENLLKYICHWMDYEVLNTAKPNSPVAIPIKTGYNHWVVVNGASTDVEPQANQHLWNLGHFTVFGLTLMDPVFGPDFIGHQVYKTASELIQDYILPLNTSDKYNGNYIAVTEPPVYNPGEEAAVEQQMKEVTVSLAQPQVNYRTKIFAANCKAGLSSFNDSESGECIDIKNIIDPHLFANEEFVNIFNSSKLSNSFYVENLSDSSKSYYLVSMEDKKTGLVHIAALVDAKQGYFKELSWSKEGHKYLKINQYDALRLIQDKRGNYDWLNSSSRLIYSKWLKDCSLYYPTLEVVINQNERWLVKQNGDIKAAPVVYVRPVKQACAGQPVKLYAKCTDVDGSIKRVQWSFGDGTYSDAVNTVHVWKKRGVYTVRFKALDNNNIWSKEAVFKIKIIQR
ncbi:MAG: PKD domain-containing protein [Candidatus Omnitrophica bacterium]|nr:PKD domain-containing protein [Candidatus Omnitrophota bacterium]